MIHGEEESGELLSVVHFRLFIKWYSKSIQNL